jgi:hypothetical protein
MSAVTSGTRNYWKSAFVKGLPDGAIDVITERGKGLEQSPMSGLLVEYCGGAGGRKPSSQCLFRHRSRVVVVSTISIQGTACPR